MAIFKNRSAPRMPAPDAMWRNETVILPAPQAEGYFYGILRRDLIRNYHDDRDLWYIEQSPKVLRVFNTKEEAEAELSRWPDNLTPDGIYHNYYVCSFNCSNVFVYNEYGKRHKSPDEYATVSNMDKVR